MSSRCFFEGPSQIIISLCCTRLKCIYGKDPKISKLAKPLKVVKPNRVDVILITAIIPYVGRNWY